MPIAHLAAPGYGPRTRDSSLLSPRTTVRWGEGRGLPCFPAATPPGSVHDVSHAYPLPLGCVWNNGTYYDTPRTGWNYSLFPYIEQDNVYKLLPASAASQEWY